MNLSNKQQSLVAGEIKAWQSEGLITADLASSLLTRYPGHEQTRNVAGAISIIGAVLVGLSTLLFIGANWQQMAVAFKLFLIVLSIVASYYFGWRLCYGTGSHPKLGSALLLLGGLFYGAGIWLIAQIFNMESNNSLGLFLWWSGTALTAMVTRSIPLGSLTAVLAGMWTFTMADSSLSRTAEHLPTLGYTALALVGSLKLAAYLRSRTVAWIALLMGVAWITVECPLHVTGVLVFSQTLFAGYLWTRKNRPLFASPFLYVSLIGTFTSLLVSTFGESLSASTAQIASLVILQLGAVASLLFVAARVPNSKLEACGSALIVLLGSLFALNGGDAVRLLFNLLLLATIAATVYVGLHRLRSPAMVNTALVFFVLDVVFRYFDMFFSMMNRSLAFIVAGILLMAVSAIAETGRRKMLQSMANRA